MERKRAILKIGNSGAVLCDEYGSSTGISLELMLGTGGVLEFELHSEAAGDNAILPDYPVSELSGGSYYFALDTACGNSDDPPLLIFSGVTLGQDDAGRSIMRVPLTGIAGQRLTDTLNGRDSVELFCELGGFDSDAKALFAWQFKVVVRSRVYSGNGSPSVVPDPAYYTAAQVEAVVARQLVFEFSADGISWHEVLSDGDIFMRARHGRGGIPSESFAVPSGKDGEPGAQGPQGEPGKDGVDGKDLMIPAGTVIMHAGNSVPDGYIICNGAEVSREIYAGLFAAIGETYGPGDGETTFTLPDFTGRIP
ncbi:MAG: tail fiber protein, partial [Lentisphaeria bacterium]|nr:tail fiber protein [Lentisphaeria bacterium]